MTEVGRSALNFHEETKHSELSVRTSSHYLDWDNRPYPFKTYKNLPTISLSHDFPHPSKSALKAIKSDNQRTTDTLDLSTLTELLFFSAGLTRKMKTRAGTYYMRAAPATGALYPIEIYVICSDIPGLKAGVYHFNPLEFSLVRLRGSYFTAEVASATGRTGITYPLTLVFTSIAWRNAWKYEARSYRHWFWDSGVIAANLLATSSSESLPIQIDLGFVDSQINHLLGLEPRKEAAVALAQIGTAQRASDSRQTNVPRLALDAEPLSREEVEYSIIWKTNEESELPGPREVKEWKTSARPRADKNSAREPMFRLQPLKEEQRSPTTLETTILKRGSTRRFAPASVSFEHLSTIMSAAASPIPMDFQPPNESLIDFYFIANQVEGIPPGSYWFNPVEGAVEQLKSGRFRDISGYLCLNQPLFADASAVFFLMTDLQRVLGSLGNRGYRAAQFEAGIRAGKIYLSSYALGNGASGSTFYDDAVTEFFSPHAKDLSTMIAVGIGIPAYRARSGAVLVPKTQPK